MACPKHSHPLSVFSRPYGKAPDHAGVVIPGERTSLLDDS